MAISGLHVGLVATASFILTRLMLIAMRIRRANHHIALLAGLLLAGGYVLLSGSGVPATRAFLMLAVGVLALTRHRAACGFRVWALALGIVVAWRPESSGNAGFVLSFSAVLLLLWLAVQSTESSAMTRPHRGIIRTLGLIRMQWVLLIGLLPATLSLFDRTAPAAPLINLLVVPVFSLLTVPATFLGLVLDGPLEKAGNILLGIAAVSIELIEALLATPGWPGGQLPVELGRAGAGVLILAAAWACLPRGWPGRWVSLPAVVALLAWPPDRVASGCARITQLDVGQGQAIVVETRTSVLLYDTGPAWPGGGSAAANVILPFLAYRGISKIDTTVVSHADLDHAGGLPALEAALPTGRKLSGEPLASAATESCHRALPWRRDGVLFRFLTTPDHDALSGNNASCVLEISTAGGRALLAGDIERPVEERLVSRNALRPADMATVPHHGSQTSSSTAFIAAVNARYAVASAAWMNRWGFPKRDVVRRWQAAGSEIVSTSEAGAVTIEACADSVSEPRLERQERRRLWHSD